MITARWRFQGSLLIALWLIPSVRPTEPRPAPALPSITGIRGALVLHGGGSLPDAVRSRFLELAGGPKARVVIIPTARADADTLDANQTLEPWQKAGLASVVLLHTRSRDRANDPAFVQPLTEAAGVWLEDGDSSRLTAAYRDTAVHRELQNLLARQGVLGGTAAGAAILGPITITGDGSRPRVERGFGFLPGGLVESNALRHNRVDRLLNVLAEHPGMYGIGIDEQTALVAQGRLLSVVGDSYVVTCQSASSTKPAGFRTLKAGGQADLVALSRSAIARTRPPFPPAIPPVPYVARGTLVIGGGGGLAEDIWKRFIRYAGGPEALIVVIPTANPDPVPVEPSEARALKRAGAKNVRILHTRDRIEANNPAFVEPLEHAGGVWFSGGRQWRFVDAYEGTAAERAFHAVLERGGVIGGSSAGASIQSAYMPRGDPLGNLNIMAEGYERGFGFLQGVAVDQHFFQRQRFPDMTDLMAVYPQLLGVGIGEGTVLVVQGSVMEVVGKSPVAVYDRRRPVAAGAKDYEELAPGTRYNLAIRERVDGKVP